MRSANSPPHRWAEVLLLRHARTTWNDQHRRQGWADQPLTLAGRQAAGEWAERASTGFAVICCSDLRRARDTARIIAAALRLGEAQELQALREQHQGAWTGLTKEQIKLRWPERLRERPRRPVGGEPPEAVLRRVLEALGSLAAAHAGRRVLAITHSDVILTLERALGVEAPPVPHLEGRWLMVSAAAVPRPASSIDWLRAGALTKGRLGASWAGAGHLAAGG